MRDPKTLDTALENFSKMEALFEQLKSILRARK